MRPKPKPKHLQTQSDWASLKRLFLCGTDACYLWGLCILQTVRHHGLSIQEELWVAEWPSLWRLGSRLKTYHEWLDEVCVTLVQGEYGEYWVSWAACSVTGCPELRVLEFKYSAAPTRRTTETSVGTGLPNHCLHRAHWFYLLISFISSCLLLCACSYLFEDFDWRLSQFP